MQIDFQKYKYFTHVLNVNGRIQEVLLRKGEKDSSFIDALTFTFSKHSIATIKGLCLNDFEYIGAFSEILIDILGFGILPERLGKGRRFYQHFFKLGSSNAEYGAVHIGGQLDTILVELNGTGCTAAKEGWEIRLYEFLKQVQRPQITRVDCAYDFFNGEYTPEQALKDHKSGLYDRVNKRPKTELRGTAWTNEDYTGKTIYIGRRGSSKLVRVYEKGRQLKDVSSEWVRFEIEFRNHDCVIPLDILTAPGEFLTGAYPVGELLFRNQASRIEAKTEKIELTFEAKLYHAKNQVGRLVRFLTDIGWTSEQIVEQLIGDEGKYPKGLEPEEYSCDGINEQIYLTKQEVEQMSQLGYGIHEPDKLDELVNINQEIEAFANSDEPKTDLEQQLLSDFPQELNEWIGKFVELRKQEIYWDGSERALMNIVHDKQRQEKELDEVLDYFYTKYGTLFPHKKRR